MMYGMDETMAGPSVHVGADFPAFLWCSMLYILGILQTNGYIVVINVWAK